GGGGETTDPIVALIEAVEAMQAEGALSAGRANALLVSLEHALARRDGGREDKALLQLKAFSLKLQAMVLGGDISEADASTLFGFYVSAVSSLG
ncbi:MAG: hypothetical protein ABFS34_11025, partial [Gemmatimonadota bacterium]